MMAKFSSWRASHPPSLRLFYTGIFLSAINDLLQQLNRHSPFRAESGIRIVISWAAISAGRYEMEKH